MAMRKILSVLLCLLFFVPMTMIALDPDKELSFSPSLSALADGTVAAQADEALTHVFPGGLRLADLTASLQTALGRNQQNGCFYSEDGILINLEEADSAVTQINLSALAGFAENTDTSCYFLLVPTSVAIEQEKIPDFALESLFNQKQYILNCQTALSAGFRSIDGYGALFPHQTEYLYYRTESALTAVGCYYLYAGAGEKLGYEARSMDDFSVSHPVHDFQGSLILRVPYSPVKADILSLFHYDSPKHTLWVYPDVPQSGVRYPLYQAPSGEGQDPLDVYLGGGPVTDFLLEGTSNEKRLLVYTDGSCDALFPLLATHYRSVRVVDLLSVEEDALSRIRPDGYDQVLFAFSVGSFGYDQSLGLRLS